MGQSRHGHAGRECETLTFGDWSAYWTRDVIDPKESPIFCMTDTAHALKGQVGFLMFARSGGNLLDLNAIKTYQHSAT